MSNKIKPVTQQPGQPPLYSEKAGGNYGQPPNYVTPGQGQMQQMNAQTREFHNDMLAQMNGEPQAVVKWAKPIPPSPKVLHGLQYLVGEDKIVLDEQKDYMSGLNVLGQFNKYRVISGKGEQLYVAEEDKSDDAQISANSRQRFAPVSRSFNVRVKDQQGTELMTISRSNQQCTYSIFAPCCSCFSSCAASVDVYAGGTHLGSITQKWSCSTRYAICDAEGVEKVEIYTQGGCCGTPTIFSLKNKGNGNFGEIQRKFHGGLNALGIKDTFEINIPGDMDPKTKALIIAATILFDYRYFYHQSMEHFHRGRYHHHGHR